MEFLYNYTRDCEVLLSYRICSHGNPPTQPGAVNKDADMTDSASGGEQMIPGTQGKPSNFSGSQYTEARTNMTGHGKYSMVPL